ncbi:TPA: DinI-like family protein [Raoultella planticola]|nr:DinI-like family protein [Raoultella planticola]HED2591873.1 DinI-like family protein [Raoultella planticola]
MSCNSALDSGQGGRTTLTLRRAGANGLSVSGGIDGDKETIEEFLQESWESADDWFY